MPDTKKKMRGKKLVFLSFFVAINSTKVEPTDPDPAK
jgi:hypothetical protein